MSEKHFGNCYEYAFKFVMENHDWKIVHGTITNRSEPFQTIYHAWCIHEDVIRDVCMKKDYPKIVYEAIFDAQTDKIYTYDQAIDMAYLYEHYGYWEEPTIIANQDEYYDKNGKLKKEYMGEHDLNGES